MLDLTDFGHLQLREEDFADVPPVDFDGAAIPDSMPEKWERLMRSNPKARELWDTNHYGDASRHAYALMGLAGWLGLDKSEAAGLHVAHYTRHGRKEDGIRKAKYALRAWEEGRRKAEARDAESGNGQPSEREPGEPLPGELESEERLETEEKKPTPYLSQGADEFLSGDITPVEWAIENIWPVGDSGPIGGSEKTGKTWIAHEMVLSLTTATPFLGKYRVKRPYRVLYWEEEDSRDRTKRRGRQLLTGRNRSIPTSYLRYLVGHGLKIDHPKGFKMLSAEVSEFRPDFVVVGNLREVHTKDENRPEMAHVRDAFRDLSRKFGCAFILIHHFRKSQADQSKRGSQMLAGSGVWGAWAEAWIYVMPGTTEDVAICEVGSKDATGIGKLVVHRRDVTDGEPLAVDEDGQTVWPVILAQVEPKDRAADSRGKILEAVKAHSCETGEAITVKKLEAKTELSRRTIVERLPELEEAGLVQPVKLHRNTNGYLPCA